MRIRAAPSAWRKASSRARRGAGQQQVGDVGTGDEKNEAHDGHEDGQRLGIGTPQIGQPAIHAFQLHMGMGELSLIPLVLRSVREAAQDLREEDVDVGGGLFDGDAGLETSEDIERLGEIFLVRTPAGGNHAAHRQGRPGIGRFADLGAEELGWHHPHNAEHRFPQFQRVVEHAGIAAQVVLPEVVTDDHHRVIAFARVVAVIQQAADFSLDPERLEVVAGHGLDADRLGLAAFVDEAVYPIKEAEDRGGVGEDHILLLKLAKERVGVELSVGKVVRYAIPVFYSQLDQLPGIADGK